MEGIILLLLIIILILVITLRSRTISETNYIANRLDELHKKVDKLSPGGLTEEPERKSQPDVDVVFPSISKPVVAEKEPEPVPPKPVVEEPVQFEPEAIAAITTTGEEIPVTADVESNAPPSQGFFERNPDLEKFIGENLANKIGIGILVVGIGFFVKYAIDQNWINEIGRVFIGIVAGGILLGLAHRLRKSLEAFSSVLVGGGIAVLYLTIAIAFHEYGIFSQAVAFVIMVGITGFAVLFSIGYDRKELAVLSILGGFASPFMVSTGEGNYVVLFTYVLILNVGMLVLAFYKKWNIVNIVCYVFTIILFGSWLSTRFESDNLLMMRGALMFATLFYLVFFAMNIINNLKERVPFDALGFGMLLSNTFLYFAAGIFILDNEAGADFRGLFTALLGVFNFVFAYLLYRNARVDRNLVFLLIGLVLTFISLAAPIQLHGNYITLFWAAEAVLLLWLSQKSGIRLMKLTSVVVTGLMIISLVMDWSQIYGYGFASEEPLNIVFNKGYITSLAAVISFVLTLVLLKRESGGSVEQVKIYRSLLMVATILCLYFMNYLELDYHARYFFPDEYVTVSMLIGTYNMLFILVLLLMAGRLQLAPQVRNAFAFWGIVAILLYIGTYHSDVVEATLNYTLSNATGVAFFFHYILIALLIAVCALSIARIRLLTDFNEKTSNAYSWVFIAFFVFLASSELEILVLQIANTTSESYDHIVTQTHKIGFPILWGLASFIIIAVGLKWKRKHLRVISLTLFLVTLIKLFIWDIRGISEGGKIAAFIFLGILLLVVSFMYQRLKKLLLEDDATTRENEAVQ